MPPVTAAARGAGPVASRPLRAALALAWAAPASAVGLLLVPAALALGARVRRVEGVLEVAGGRLPALQQRLPRPLRFAAITFGHVVLGTDPATLETLRLHEHVHVRQYARWGVLFFPLYLGSSAWQALRGRHWYRDNAFERAAFAAEAAAAQAAAAHATPPQEPRPGPPAGSGFNPGSCRS